MESKEIRIKLPGDAHKALKDIAEDEQRSIANQATFVVLGWIFRRKKNSRCPMCGSELEITCTCKESEEV